MKLFTLSLLSTLLASAGITNAEPLCQSQCAGYCQGVYKCNQRADTFYVDCVFGIYDNNCNLVGHKYSPNNGDAIGAGGIPYTAVVTKHTGSTDSSKIKMEFKYGGMGFGKSGYQGDCQAEFGRRPSLLGDGVMPDLRACRSRREKIVGVSTRSTAGS
ncbi:hypothetical protein BU16DRAFT_539594 [Lophium mytilinum]|uniref:Uncharacterized protein n=1 Tax=Lophium mytilinum TaxID=390894 RepID=A0A6A6QTD6_9PEZI|nr:hypothetical protein BU16DRAFT_539594 [Lophium mytilinum]